MQSNQKKLDSRNKALESNEQNLAQEVATALPHLAQNALSRKNLSVLSFLIPSWQFLKLIFALIALYLLIQHDGKAQMYQQYPISPTSPAVPAPKYSPKYSLIIAKHSDNIITRSQITKGDDHTVICDLFFAGSRITSIQKIGSYWKVKSQFRTYTDVYFFKAKNYDLSWIKVGMKTQRSQRHKDYVQRIKAHQAKISQHNDSIRKAHEQENRSFISKIINPND